MLARQRGCRAIVIEDLDFAERPRARTRTALTCPPRGARGRRYRRWSLVRRLAGSGDRLVEMAARYLGLGVIAAYRSRYFRAGGPSTGSLLFSTRHYRSSRWAIHAAAVVIGRRAVGHRARRRACVTGGGQPDQPPETCSLSTFAATLGTRRSTGRPCQAPRQRMTGGGYTAMAAGMETPAQPGSPETVRGRRLARTSSC